MPDAPPEQTRLFVPAVLVSLACAAAMWVWTGEESIPYHLGFATLAMAYGLEAWSPARALAALSTYTVVSGAVLVYRIGQDLLEWQEASEIPLMALLMALLIWHVRVRQAALGQVTWMADRDRERAHSRELLARLTSHEMRTPLTIATGYVDLLLDADLDGRHRCDLEVVREELDRLARAGERLVRMIRYDDALDATVVDVDALVEETARRWAAVVERDWQVDARAGHLSVPPERLRACLDTLVENAVRYTGTGQVVRLFAERRGDTVVLGVADSGPGFSPAVQEALRTARVGHEGPLDPAALRDVRAQTGLGLALVRQVVHARGGRMLVGTAPEGGAEVSLVLPAGPVPVAETDLAPPVAERVPGSGGAAR